MALQTEADVETELGILRTYLKRRRVIEGELEILKEDLKALDDEFKEKLDIKTLRLASSVAKAKSKVAHKFTFDNFLEVLEDEGWMEKDR